MSSINITTLSHPTTVDNTHHTRCLCDVTCNHNNAQLSTGADGILVLVSVTCFGQSSEEPTVPSGDQGPLYFQSVLLDISQLNLAPVGHTMMICSAHDIQRLDATHAHCNRIRLSGTTSINVDGGTATPARTNVVFCEPLIAENTSINPESTNLIVNIERRKHDEATISWNIDSATGIDLWLISITNNNEETYDFYLLAGKARSLKLPTLLMKMKYLVSVSALRRMVPAYSQNNSQHVAYCYKTVDQQLKEFLTVYTKSELEELKRRALLSIRSSSPCRVLYRNKSPEYFENIFSQDNGIMKAYMKDDNGDRLSPINGQILGLFFMAGVQPGTDGEPYRESAFGSTRLLVPVDFFMSRGKWNLYFSDFYCLAETSSCHYVTLVLTKADSPADRFCSEYLLPLSIDDSSSTGNKFFYRDTATGSMRVASETKVEILYTDDIDISYLMKHCDAKIETNIPLHGNGRSLPGEVPKWSSCSKCNLY